MTVTLSTISVVPCQNLNMAKPGLGPNLCVSNDCLPIILYAGVLPLATIWTCARKLRYAHVQQLILYNDCIAWQ